MSRQLLQGLLHVGSGVAGLAVSLHMLSEVMHKSWGPMGSV